MTNLLLELVNMMLCAEATSFMCLGGWIEVRRILTITILFKIWIGFRWTSFGKWIHLSTWPSAGMAALKETVVSLNCIAHFCKRFSFFYRYACGEFLLKHAYRDAHIPVVDSSTWFVPAFQYIYTSSLPIHPNCRKGQMIRRSPCSAHSYDAHQHC